MSKNYEHFEKLDFSSNYISGNPVITMLLSRFLLRLWGILHDLRTDVKTALEIGSGEGYSTSVIKSSLPDKAVFISSDLIPELAKRNTQRSGVSTVLVQDINALAVKSQSVDLVVALEVLEHLPDPHAAVEELGRVSRKWVIVSVPFEPWWRIGNLLRGAYWNDWGNTPDHRNHWGKKSLSRLLRRKFSRVRTIVSFPWLIALCKDPARKEAST
jgi:ubiquinone/menaquinone biosynthesis C-methylase UbiE